MICVDYSFTPAESCALHDVLHSIGRNPYTEYESFIADVAKLIADGRVPKVLYDIARYSRERDGYRKPFVMLQNCPIDEHRPVFDFVRPVASKHELKKTWIAEGFLTLYSVLLRTPIIRYAMINDGDPYHDIFPMEKLSESLSQKSLVTLGHHQDFPIHFARPRWVAMIALRNPRMNDVYSTFVRNVDVIEALDEDTRQALSLPDFHTPYDDVTKHGDRQDVMHNVDDWRPIRSGNMLSYYEGRTRARTASGQQALATLNAAIARVTHRLQLDDGEFIHFDNETTMHGRDVACIRDASAHKTRWLIKVHTAPSLMPYRDRFIADRPGVVNG
jgi:L-asparagine oxygenase